MQLMQNSIIKKKAIIYKLFLLFLFAFYFSLLYRIANYNPDDDEYYTKKNNNGFIGEPRLENNNTPICVQPNRLFNGLNAR